MNSLRHPTHFFTHVEAFHQFFLPISAFPSPFYRHHLRPESPLLLSHLKARHYNVAIHSEKRTQYSRRQDEQIDDRAVQLVDENNQLLAPQQPRDILHRMDRQTHFLVEVAPATGENFAVCRIMSRQQVVENEKAMLNKPKTKTLQTKQLEFNWAIGQNDLQHKLGRMKLFLEEGRRVEVIVAKKRKGRDATPEEKTKLLAAIKAFADDLEGVREWKPMMEMTGKRAKGDGDMDEQMMQKKPKHLTTMIFFEGRQLPRSKVNTSASKEETEPRKRSKKSSPYVPS